MSEKQRLLCPETIAKIEHSRLIKRVLDGQPYATRLFVDYRKVQIGGPMGVDESGTPVYVLFIDKGPRGKLGPGLIKPGIKYVGYTSQPQVFAEHLEERQNEQLRIEVGRKVALRKLKDLFNLRNQ